MTLLLGSQKRNPIKKSPCDLIAVYFIALQEVLLKSFRENFPRKGPGEKAVGSPVGLFSIYCLWKQEFFLQAAPLSNDAWRFLEEKENVARMQYFTTFFFYRETSGHSTPSHIRSILLTLFPLIKSYLWSTKLSRSHSVMSQGHPLLSVWNPADHRTQAEGNKPPGHHQHLFSWRNPKPVHSLTVNADVLMKFFTRGLPG